MSGNTARDVFCRYFALKRDVLSYEYIKWSSKGDIYRTENTTSLGEVVSLFLL